MSLFDVVGQKRIAEMLSKSIKNQRIGHAYVFAGPRGVGKSKMALEFAKALHCKSKPADACDACQNCKRIEHHHHPDVIWLEPDGSTIKIDQIRQLQKDFNYKSVDSGYKVFIIEQAEVMTLQAANSLLKFLEEPYSPTVAILITENPHQLLPTIRSRCQIIQFSHLDPFSIVNTLKEEGYAEKDVLLAAHVTEDIQEVKVLLESEQFANMRSLVIKWSEDIDLRSSQLLYTLNDKIMKNDYIKEHVPLFLDLLLLWYRDILNIKLKRNAFIIYRGYEQTLNKQALHVTEENIIQRMDRILQVKKQIAAHVNLQLALEQMVLSLWEG